MPGLLLSPPQRWCPSGRDSADRKRGNAVPLPSALTLGRASHASLQNPRCSVRAMISSWSALPRSQK